MQREFFKQDLRKKKIIFFSFLLTSSISTLLSNISAFHQVNGEKRLHHVFVSAKLVSSYKMLANCAKHKSSCTSWSFFFLSKVAETGGGRYRGKTSYWSFTAEIDLWRNAKMQSRRRHGQLLVFLKLKVECFLCLWRKKNQCIESFKIQPDVQRRMQNLKYF